MLLKFFRRQPQNAAATTPVPPPATPPAPQQSAAIQPQPIKTLAELERELEAKDFQVQPNPTRHRLRDTFNRLKWMAVLLGIPLGLLWAVNLPYAVIRRPIARTAPILLLPSYISIDHNYRQAIALIEQADQLINNATTAADLDLGEQKVNQAQVSLNALPVGYLNEPWDYRYGGYGWYNWRFSLSNFNDSRARAGQLQAKVFQEKNAQNALLTAEQAISSAQQQYQQASTSVDKSLAIATWRSALNQFEMIPGQTLAGQTAQQKYSVYQQTFQEVVGLAAGNERIGILIQAAREFAWQAAKTGQNPPHSVEQWYEIERLWQEAIQRLEVISSDDLTGYAEAQKLQAQYTTNLAEIRIRRQKEQSSVAVFKQAEDQITRLQATASDRDFNFILSQLQDIINQLERVENGTTVYSEAQNLLVSAKLKLQQLQPK